MNRAANKASRLLQIEALLLAHPEGLTPAQIARRLGVNRSTVGRDLPDLPKHIYVDDLDGGRWKIDRDAYLVNVRLTLHEALAVHLATRLLAGWSDRRNPHAGAALRKLGGALERLAPLVSAHLHASAEVMDEEAQRHDPLYLDVLETLTRAWSLGRKVRLWHKHAPSGRVYEYVFAPYFIEPYAAGQTTHVIGWREPPGALRTFKLERIQRIELLTERYTIPEDFDPRVAGRVQETRWHRSEDVDEQPDGSLVWRARVAEPQEMVHWIRGWGADVEVLGPEGLRDQMTGEARRWAEAYGWQVTRDGPADGDTLDQTFSSYFGR